MFGTERPVFLQVVLNPVREHRARFEALSDAQVEQTTLSVCGEWFDAGVI
jgi:hypothetical protein